MHQYESQYDKNIQGMIQFTVSSETKQYSTEGYSVEKPYRKAKGC